MWTELFLLNREPLVQEIDEIIKHLTDYRTRFATARPNACATCSAMAYDQGKYRLTTAPIMEAFASLFKGCGFSGQSPESCPAGHGIPS